MFDSVLGRPFRGPGVWPPAAAAVVLGLLLAISGPAVAQQEPPAVTVAKPVVREIVEDDEFVGRFQAVDEVAIRSRVSGYLDQVHFRDGALVSKGQLLFTIDRRPYQTTYDAARSQVDVASSVLDFTKAQFERADELAKSGNLSISTLDDRRREYLSAQAAFQGATAALQSSKLNLEFTEIKAPLSGRIDRRLVSVGNLVQSDSTLLTTIVATDPIDFYFDIDERIYLAYARDARERGGVLQDGGSRLEVKVRIADRGETSFDGTLDFAENRIDSATGTLRTRARFANPDGILQPGMFGRINVPGSLPYKGVLIPDEALGSDQDRRIVLVVDDAGAVSAKPVRIGPRIDGYRVIREGLTGDETIIINGLMRVRPGITVKPELVVLPPVAETAGSK
ncbi:efflux RND transporter periplasmic adaptor subunit [Mesorhizobium sp. 10J20-29]